MKVQAEPAVCSGGSPKQTASNKQLLKRYQKSQSVSSLKLQIGELLLFGDKQRGEFWSLFEVLLRQYWGDKT
ncbi:MAG: hypothetical protein JXA81_14945 [Sedimentisphaerales bacterium]|nr:hypothetical protein [Sedimentisphaerales bacterium]